MNDYQYLRDVLSAALKDRSRHPASLVSVQDLIDGEILAVATHKAATERWLSERRAGGELSWTIASLDSLDAAARARVEIADRSIQYLQSLSVEAKP